MWLTSLIFPKVLSTKGLRLVRLSGFNLTQTSLLPHFYLMRPLMELPYNQIKKGKFKFNNIINKETIKKVYGKSLEVIIEEEKLKNKDLKTGFQK